MSFEPVTVYLDNNDYSYLTDPRRKSEFVYLRQQLQMLAQQGAVQFFYSGSMLSEISPVRDSDKELARRRAELLSQLCGQNAMISFDRVVAGELEQLYGAPVNPHLAKSFDGDWFPDVGELMPSTRAKESLLKDALEDAIAERAPNRKMRRGVRSMAVGKRGVRAGVLPPSDPGMLASGTLPIRPKDYAVVSDYMAGRATRAQALDAFKSSLRDPTWIVLYLTASEGSPTKLAEIIRNPAEVAINRMIQNIDGLIDQLALIRERNPDFELPDKFWINAWDEQLANITLKLDEKNRQSSSASDSKQIAKRCPGLTCFFGIAFELFRRRLSGGKRQLARNDFQDAMHATYAPYVDVFRADGNTASMLRSRAKRCGTVVVDRLEQLPDMIARVQNQKVEQGSS